MKRLSFPLLLGLVFLLFYGCECDCDALSTCFEADPCEDCNDECAAYIQTELRPISFSFTSPTFAQGSINESTREITIQVPFGTDLSNVVGQATAKEGVSIFPSIENGMDLSSLNETFRFSKGTQTLSYELQITVAAPILPSVMEAWFDVFEGQGIGAACAIDSDQDNVLLFNRSGTQYAQIIGGQVQGIYASQSSAGRLAGCPYSSVGTAQVFGEDIYVFNSSGTTFAILKQTGWTPLFELSKWGKDNTHPFRTSNNGQPAGVGATLFYTNSRSIHFNRGGTRWVTYTPNNGGSFGGVKFLEDWGGNAYNIPFPAVSSALQIRTSLGQLFSGASGESYVQVLFNGEGTEVVFYNAGYGFSDVYPIADR